MTAFLDELNAIIKDKKRNPTQESYTASLFSKGKDRLLKKIGEEAGEVIIASKNNDRDELKNEAADLIFHLMVVLEELDISLSDVVDVLESRNK